MLPSSVNAENPVSTIFSPTFPLVISNQDPDIHSFFYNYFRLELSLNTLHNLHEEHLKLLLFPNV